MPDIANSEATDRLLSALGEQLAALGQRYELVVSADRVCWLSDSLSGRRVTSTFSR
jgi:hypothetical protein